MNISPSKIMEQASAFYGSCILFTASDLGVFKVLDDHGTADLVSISKEIDGDLRGTRLLLDGCVAVGLITKDGELYSNTAETAAFLVPGKPGDLSGAIRYNRDVYSAWGKLPELVKSGVPVESPELHLGDDAARTRAFVMSMHGRAMGIGQMLIPMLDLKDCRNLLDIGGGSGAYAILSAQNNQALSCTVMDLPAVSAIAAELVEAAGVADRVKCVAGDYHDAEFPVGNDVVNILGVLHQESPEYILDILKRSYDALVPGGKINILDMMTDETRCSPPFSALFAVNMALTAENGWVFSSKDMEEWLTDAGFVDFECVALPPPMPHWLITARKG